MALRYTGGGYGGFLPGLPARDLSDEEVEALGGEKALVKTGLYEPFGKKAEPATESKKARGGAENKEG